ncbi:uncharacterized protein LOC141597429 isoform X2 [Silene latifolia]|uniref:uncharacterized protein LOC141597429 isoform X2 n=1 Tax=Silene latifolia TaxID=37657 RepID=UPI003D776EBB
MRRRTIHGYGDFSDYWEMCEESDGFDVNPMGKLLCGGIVEGNKLDKQERAKVMKLAKHAVHDYNKKEKKELRFVSLIKYNGQIAGGMMYYITFTARSLTRNKTGIYQAKVYSHRDRRPAVKIFQEKPKPAIPLPKGAFLRFLGLVCKIPEFSEWSYEKKLALRAWKNTSHKAKLKYFTQKNLKDEDVQQFQEWVCALFYPFIFTYQHL